jgi:hypothetical protein
MTTSALKLVTVVSIVDPEPQSIRAPFWAATCAGCSLCAVVDFRVKLNLPGAPRRWRRRLVDNCSLSRRFPVRMESYG